MDHTSETRLEPFDVSAPKSELSEEDVQGFHKLLSEFSKNGPGALVKTSSVHDKITPTGWKQIER
jgi:hypothetical protein